MEEKKKHRRRMLLCGKVSRNGVVSGSVPVYLNVYDLTQFNGYAYWFGLGVYHSGVQGSSFSQKNIVTLILNFSELALDLI